jgi:hypothetical protein
MRQSLPMQQKPHSTTTPNTRRANSESSRRSRPAPRQAAIVAAVLALAALAQTHKAQASPASPRANAARTTAVTDEAHLHLTATEGELLEEEGPVKGTIPGKLHIRLTVGPTVKASFTIYAAGGTITGHGSMHLHSATRYSSFSGPMSVNRGTGRYAHARGTGNFYGVIDRKTNALTVQTTGKLTY